MNLTPTQRKIIELLPATPDDLARALYNRATDAERRLIYVHIALLRRRLDGDGRVVSRRRARMPDDGSSSRIIYEFQTREGEP